VALAEYERARGDARPELWSDAADTWEQLERPPLAAYCRWRQAEALVAAGAARAEASVSLEPATSGVTGRAKACAAASRRASTGASHVRVPDRGCLGRGRQGRVHLGHVRAHARQHQERRQRRRGERPLPQGRGWHGRAGCPGSPPRAQQRSVPPARQDLHDRLFGSFLLLLQLFPPLLSPGETALPTLILRQLRQQIPAVSGRIRHSRDANSGAGSEREATFALLARLGCVLSEVWPHTWPH
jgi:hypothetical protein